MAAAAAGNATNATNAAKTIPDYGYFADMPSGAGVNPVVSINTKPTGTQRDAGQVNTAQTAKLDEIEVPDANADQIDVVDATPNLPDQTPPSPDLVDEPPSLKRAASKYRPIRGPRNEAAKNGLTRSSTEGLYQVTAHKIRVADNRLASKFGSHHDEDWFEHGDSVPNPRTVAFEQVMPGSSAPFFFERRDNPLVNDLEVIPVHNGDARVQLVDRSTFNRSYRNLTQIPAVVRRSLF